MRSPSHINVPRLANVPQAIVRVNRDCGERLDSVTTELMLAKESKAAAPDEGEKP
jgi:hypothetical protein